MARQEMLSRCHKEANVAIKKFFTGCNVVVTFFNTVKTKIRRAKAQLLKMMDYSDELL